MAESGGMARDHQLSHVATCTNVSIGQILSLTPFQFDPLIGLSLTVTVRATADDLVEI